MSEGKVTSEETVIDLLVGWDDLDSAINRVVTALPGQMTPAADRLEAERLRFRARLQNYAFGRLVIKELPHD